MDFKSLDAGLCKEALSSYEAVIKNLGKPDLVSLDDFYRKELPNILHERDPKPYITTDELSRLMQWKLSRGKWRPRLLSFVSSLDDAVVRDASGKAFASLPDVAKSISELTVLKGVGPATSSAVLAAYAPDVAPFMSDEVFVWRSFCFSISGLKFWDLCRVCQSNVISMAITIGFTVSEVILRFEFFHISSWSWRGVG